MADIGVSETPAERFQPSTFKTRQRGLSPEQNLRLDQLLSRFGLDADGSDLDIAAQFRLRGPQQRVALEIGIGFGESMVSMARHDPDTNVIGCEVHTPGILAAAEALDDGGIDHVRLVHGDALTFVQRLGSDSLDELRLFFPDPWPKARHRHRRMMTEPRLAVLLRPLRPGGRLHIATDVADYALQVERVCGQEPQLEGGRVPRPPTRARTKYERKAEAADRPVADLVYRYKPAIDAAQDSREPAPTDTPPG